MIRTPASLLGRAVAVLGGILPFAVITLLVTLDWSPLRRLDRSIAESVHSYAAGRPGFVDLWQVVGIVTHPWVWRGVAVLVAAYLWRQRARMLAIWLVVAGGTALGLVQAAKYTFDRARPPERLIELGDPSYVSGHATAAFVVAGALAVVLPSVRRWRRRTWLPVAFVAGAMALLTSLDRILLDVHYLSDVLGGWALGLAVLSVSTVAFGLRSRRRAHITQNGEDGMAKPRAAVIVNPIKVGDGAAFRRKVTKAVLARGYDDPLWLETTKEDAGHAMAQQAKDEHADLVLVAGGDGTVRAVCAALAHTDIPVAVLPAGTGNLLARNLHIPLDLDDALEQVLDGRDRRIDMVHVEGDGLEPDRFAVMAGLGLDAAIISDAPDQLKKQIGWTAYLVSAAKNVNHPSVKVRITVDDGEVLERRVRTVVVGNVGHLQANFPLLPDARPDDGLLDVLVIAPRRVTQWPVLIARVVTRQKKSDKQLERFTGRRVEIVAADAVQRQLDGDGIGSGSRITAEVEPAALIVRVPDDS